MRSTPHTQHDPAAPLTIRMALPADAAALDRLAQLDSASPPEAKAMLVAEVGGELRAALPLGGGRVLADPFERTAALVAMLAERSRQLEAPASRRPRLRPRLLRVPRPASPRGA